MSPDMASLADHGLDGPLAEFSALRDEILERVKAQNQVFVLQLTLSSAIFGFAISKPGMTPLLLVMPLSSYLLCGRLVALHFGTLRVAKYIMEELNCRVPGGLKWEHWLRKSSQRPHFLGSVLPLLLSFVGSSVLALGGTFGYVFVREGVAVLSRIGLIVLWLVGLGTVYLCSLLILQMSGRLKVRDWEQAGLF